MGSKKKEKLDPSASSVFQLQKSESVDF